MLAHFLSFLVDLEIFTVFGWSLPYAEDTTEKGRGAVRLIKQNPFI